MLSKTELRDVWDDLAELIAALPVEERTRYQIAIMTLVHDLRQNIAVIHGVESLLRRTMPATPDNLELLDGLRVASQRSIALVTDLAGPFDSEITLPLGRRPGPDKEA